MLHNSFEFLKIAPFQNILVAFQKKGSADACQTDDNADIQIDCICIQIMKSISKNIGGYISDLEKHHIKEQKIPVFQPVI